MMLEALERVKTYTIDEYLELPDDGNRYELVEGVLVEMGVTGDEHGEITLNLARRMADYVDEHNLGKVKVCTGFQLAQKTVRAPDVAFIKAERVPPVSKGAVSVVPDLAVEVISPGDDWSKIVEKVREYQKYGVALIWLIDPNLKAAFIFHPSDKLPIITDQELDGEQLIKDFKMNLEKLFE